MRPPAFGNLNMMSNEQFRSKAEQLIEGVKWSRVVFEENNAKDMKINVDEYIQKHIVATKKKERKAHRRKMQLERERKELEAQFDAMPSFDEIVQTMKRDPARRKQTRETLVKT